MKNEEIFTRDAMRHLEDLAGATANAVRFAKNPIQDSENEQVCDVLAFLSTAETKIAQARKQLMIFKEKNS